jgi:hypothetical protein
MVSKLMKVLNIKSKEEKQAEELAKKEASRLKWENMVLYCKPPK